MPTRGPLLFARAASLLLALLFSLATPPAQSHASRPEASTVLEAASKFFSQANEAALTDPLEARRLYRKAARRFHELSTSYRITNPYLLANLGNAALLAGDLGQAIFAYRRATQLPGAPPALRQSLAHARGQVSTRFDTPFENPLRRAWSYLVKAPRPLWLILFGLAWPGFFLTLYRTGIAPSGARIRWLGWIAVTALTCLLSLLFLRSQTRRQNHPFGVLVADSTIVRNGDGMIYDPAFSTPLAQGIEFTPIQMRRGWIQVRFTDGTTGWIEEGQALLWPRPESQVPTWRQDTPSATSHGPLCKNRSRPDQEIRVALRPLLGYPTSPLSRPCSYF